MHYKIPVQIENEDKIVFWLSIRQIVILWLGWAIAYNVFQSLAAAKATDIWIILGLLIFWIFAGIALFKVYEMTFLPAILNFVRFQLNAPIRIWEQGVSSYSVLEIGYTSEVGIKQEEVITKNVEETYKTLESQLTKI